MALIFLSGFMGVGKTTVGRELASILNYPWIDTDHQIQASTGKTPAQIFAEQGESAFRELETQIISQLAHRQELVVSLGGGAVLKEQNRQILRTATWINLTASVDTLLKRLQSHTASRPLLSADAPKETSVATFFNQRQEIYKLAPFQIVTDSDTPEMTAQKISALIAERHT